MTDYERHGDGDHSEPIRTVTMNAGRFYLVATKTDGIVVAAFRKRRRDLGLVFGDAVLMNATPLDREYRLLFYPEDLIYVDEWRHAPAPLLPLCQLSDFEPESPSRLLFHIDGASRKDGTP